MSRSGFAESLLEQGARQRLQGDFENSVLSFQSLLKIEPDNARAWYELGISYATEGEYGRAVDAYRLALSHGFTEGQCHCALGLALRETHKTQVALNESKRCLELLPLYAGAWNLIGNVETDLGHFNEARKAYQSAVTLRPGYANAHFNLGLTLDALNLFAEAEGELKEAIRLQPGMTQSWTALGDCQLRNQRAGDALKSYSAALRQSPADADAEWGMARAFRSLGSPEKAEAHESAYRRLVREADNRSYFPKDGKEKRAIAREMEAWSKEARERN